MKKLILFIGFIALTGALLAQTWQPSLFKYIQSYSQCELVQHNTPNAVNTIRYADTASAQYQNFLKYLTGNHFYSFVKNKKLYILSYDACNTCYREPAVGYPIKRDLFLFRLDVDNWTKVSDAIQTDYYSLDSSINEVNVPQHNIWSSYCYFPWRTAGNLPNDKGRFGYGVKDGSVIVSDDGEITIVLVNRKNYYDDKSVYRESFENKTVVLETNGEFYTLKK